MVSKVSLNSGIHEVGVEREGFRFRLEGVKCDGVYTVVVAFPVHGETVYLDASSHVVELLPLYVAVESCTKTPAFVDVDEVQSVQIDAVSYNLCCVLWLQLAFVVSGLQV